MKIKTFKRQRNRGRNDPRGGIYDRLGKGNSFSAWNMLRYFFCFLFFLRGVPFLRRKKTNDSRPYLFPIRTSCVERPESFLPLQVVYTNILLSSRRNKTTTIMQSKYVKGSTPYLFNIKNAIPAILHTYKQK